MAAHGRGGLAITGTTAEAAMAAATGAADTGDGFFAEGFTRAPVAPERASWLIAGTPY